MSQYFRPPFFHDSNPSRPLINRLKYFRIWFQFCQDIGIFKQFRGVHHTAESSSRVCIIPRSQAPQCASHRRVKLRSVHHTTESSDQKFFKNYGVCISHRVRLRSVHPSAVCIPPQSRAPRCSLYRRVRLRGVHCGVNNLQVSVLI